MGSVQRIQQDRPAPQPLTADAVHKIGCCNGARGIWRYEETNLAPLSNSGEGVCVDISYFIGRTQFSEKQVEIRIDSYGKDINEYTLKEAKDKWSAIKLWGKETGRDPRDRKGAAI